MQLLQLPHASAHPLVLDLGGRHFRGSLGEELPPSASPAPVSEAAPVPGVDLVLRQPCIIRNGMLHLRGRTRLVIVAPGCRLEDVTIRGQGNERKAGVLPFCWKSSRIPYRDQCISWDS